MKFRNLFCAFIAALSFCPASPLCAQSSSWDALLTNSSWYVPTENLLAYATVGDTFSNPQAAADQTLWSLGTSVNGVFTGDSVGLLKVGMLEFSSMLTMEGVVTDSGQIRIIFSQPDTPDTIGIGQMREIGGIYYMEMQMVLQSSMTLTHWAYMASYDPLDTEFTPPAPVLDPLPLDPGLLSEEWAWTQNTEWTFLNDALFGEGESGNFTITDYVNGYFWGAGSGPEGSAAESFTLLGSMTPEGDVLYNLYADGTLYSLTGYIVGDGLTGEMALRSYDGSATFGEVGYANMTPVPEPSTWVLLVCGIAVCIFARVRILRGNGMSDALALP